MWKFKEYKIKNIKTLEVKKMTTEQKIKLNEYRLQILESRDKDNFGVCVKVRRNIRNMQKKQ